MKPTILMAVLGLAGATTLLLAQQEQPKAQPQAQPAQPPAQAPPSLVPNTKSEGESQAVKALVQSQNNPDAMIKAAEDLITRYSDSFYKEMALVYEANAYQRKGDTAKAQVYGEQALKVNPKNLQMPNMLGGMIVQQTKEHDLDKDEKLASAEKYFNLTIADLKDMAKPNPQLPDAQWEDIKKYYTAEAHQGLGLVALQRKNYAGAIAELKIACDTAPEEAAFQVRLASVYQQAGKNAEAIAVCDKLLADPQLDPEIRVVAQGIKADASKK